MKKDIVGPTVRLLRQKQSMSAKELAIKSGLTVTTISRIEMGHQPIGMKSALGLRKALGDEVIRLVSPSIAEDLGWKDTA